MKIIIPVAGYGTRLRPHTHTLQKSLLPVAGKTVLDHIIDPLIAQDIREITLIVGHFADQVRQHIKSIPCTFHIVEQKERLGLGHAVYQGMEDRDEPLLIQLGDTIFPKVHHEFSSPDYNTIAVMPVDDPSRFGVIETDGDFISGFHEKVANPPTNLAISGLYGFHSERVLRQALEDLFKADIRTKGEFQLTDALALMLKNGEPFQYRQVSYHDVGVPDTFLDTNRALLKSDHPDFSGVKIEEPVYIGKNCRIENSTIGPYVTVMDHCTITDCAVSDAIVLEDAHLRDRIITRKIIAGDGSLEC